MTLLESTIHADTDAIYAGLSLERDEIRAHLVAVLAEETLLDRDFHAEGRWCEEEKNVLWELYKRGEITQEYYMAERQKTEGYYKQQRSEHMRQCGDLYKKYGKCPQIRIRDKDGDINVDATVNRWVEQLAFSRMPREQKEALKRERNRYRYKPKNMTEAAWDALSAEMKDYYESGARGWSTD